MSKLKLFIAKSKSSMGLAALALVLATVTANSTCFFYSYQPKIPEKLIRK